MKEQHIYCPMKFPAMGAHNFKGYSFKGELALGDSPPRLAFRQ